MQKKKLNAEIKSHAVLQDFIINSDYGFYLLVYLQLKHLCGRRHHDKLKDWSLRLFPTSYPVTQQEIDLLDDSHYEETEDDNMEDDALVE